MKEITIRINEKQLEIMRKRFEGFEVLGLTDEQLIGTALLIFNQEFGGEK